MEMIIDLGLIDYEEAYKIQKECVSKRRRGEIADTYILAEHPPVFTIGRSVKDDNLLVSEDFLAKKGIKALRVDRGGDITFHGPGQLVLYPILDLRPDKKDLHKYLRSLEAMAIKFLAGYGIDAFRVPEKTGAWVNSGKIASIGIGSSNWITFHGLSVNINVDLGYFSMINPCGLKGVEMVSVESVLGKSLYMSEARDKLVRIIDEDAKLFSAVA